MNQLASRRKNIGLTQAQLAERLGVDQTAVSQWETGKSLPRAELLPKIAQIYSCSIDELLAERNDATGTT